MFPHADDTPAKQSLAPRAVCERPSARHSSSRRWERQPSAPRKRRHRYPIRCPHAPRGPPPPPSRTRTAAGSLVGNMRAGAAPSAPAHRSAPRRSHGRRRRGPSRTAPRSGRTGAPDGLPTPLGPPQDRAARVLWEARGEPSPARHTNVNIGWVGRQLDRGGRPIGAAGRSARSADRDQSPIEAVDPSARSESRARDERAASIPPPGWKNTPRTARALPTGVRPAPLPSRSSSRRSAAESRVAALGASSTRRAPTTCSGRLTENEPPEGGS
jgi:hypothetical protein